MRNSLIFQKRERLANADVLASTARTYIDVPVLPGLGIEVDEEQLKSKIGHNWQNKRTYDPNDGSVVDW